jgi:glycerol uptake facilitator protein
MELATMANQNVSAPSALSGLWGECIAEFLGTMVLLLFGDGCVATFALFTNLGANNAATPFANEWIVITVGWGMAVMLGIYVAGAVSGAHINPAVTIAFAVRGKFPWNKVAPYIIAQVLGGFIAALILYFVYQGALVHQLGVMHLNIGQIAQPVTSNGLGWVFYTYPKAFVGTFGAFCDEFIGTALLVGLIFAIVDVRNQPVQANLNPMIIGFLVLAIGLSFGLNTGYAINPARDFGPRLWIAIVSGGTSIAADNFYFWIPIVAPIAGGIVGALIYDFTIAKVLIARGALPSGEAEVQGRAVREEPAGGGED